METWYNAVSMLKPYNEQERVDQRLMLEFLAEYGVNALLRKNPYAHFSATAFIVNESRDRLVVVRHKIYDGWMIPGGHADGNPSPLIVAETEAEEETGLVPRVLNDGEVFALQALPTKSHVHRSRGYVPAHTHYDLTYLFEAPDDAELKYAPDESDGIRWLSFEMAGSEMAVDFMRPVQKKLVDKLQEGGRW